MTDTVTHLITQFGQWAIFLLSALESACVPIPSEIVVPPGGFLAFRGLLSFWGVVAAATLGNGAGSALAWWVGRTGGRAFVERYGRYVLLNTDHVAQAERWFARHGEITVCVARLLPAFRTFISLPAGIARMPFGRFMVFSLLGALPWNLALAAAGYALGANWPALEQHLKPVSYLGALCLLAVVVWVWWRGRRATRPTRKTR